ncbi:MAG: AtpZ/AtpI family protein [Pseudonocardiaceae bacterium]
MKRRSDPDLSTLLSFGLATAACLVVGLGLGWLVDLALDTLPVFLLVGLGLGIVATCLYIYYQIKSFLKE